MLKNNYFIKNVTPINISTLMCLCIYSHHLFPLIYLLKLDFRNEPRHLKIRDILIFHTFQTYIQTKSKPYFNSCFSSWFPVPGTLLWSYDVSVFSPFSIFLLLPTPRLPLPPVCILLRAVHTLFVGVLGKVCRDLWDMRITGVLNIPTTGPIFVLVISKGLQFSDNMEKIIRFCLLCEFPNLMRKGWSYLIIDLGYYSKQHMLVMTGQSDCQTVSSLKRPASWHMLCDCNNKTRCLHWWPSHQAGILQNLYLVICWSLGQCTVSCSGLFTHTEITSCTLSVFSDICCWLPLFLHCYNKTHWRIFVFYYWCFSLYHDTNVQDALHHSTM